MHIICVYDLQIVSRIITLWFFSVDMYVAEVTKDKPNTLISLKHLRKQPQEKHTAHMRAWLFLNAAT